MSNGDVFSDIAARYDRINRLLSLGRDQAWRRLAAQMADVRKAMMGGYGKARKIESSGTSEG